MYKFTNQLQNNAKLVLVRKHVGDGSCSALIVMRTPRRTYKGPEEICPPPPKAKKSHKLFWGMVGATALTGAAVVYAKSNAEARSWLESNVPWANDFVALVYQENTTYWKFTTNQLGKISDTVADFLFGKEGISPPEVKPLSDNPLEKTCDKQLERKDYSLPQTAFEPLYVEEVKIETPEVDTPATIVQTDKCDPPQPKVIKITKDMVELEQEMHENIKMAIDNYKAAVDLCHNYNRTLYKIIETPLLELDQKTFTSYQGALIQRNNTTNKAKEAADKARTAMDALERLMQAGVQAPPEAVTATKRYIKQFRADLTAAENLYKAEHEKAILSDKYWNKVESARNMFKDELQSLFPGIDLSTRQLELKGDVDLLLLYSMTRIQYLQNQLAEIQTLRDYKINKAIECRDDKAIIEAKAEEIIKKERLQQDLDYQKKVVQIQADANRKLNSQLKKQIEIQQEITQDKLQRKEKEVMATFSRAVSEQMESERVAFKKNLAAMSGKLTAIEQTLKQRAKAEQEARRSQSLWTAAEALLATTRRNAHEASIDNELKALEKAGKDDKLVQTVIKGIPQDIRQAGIATEKALKEKFDKMEATTMKVALVGREGASLPVYFLSWLQSKLLFQKFAEIPNAELENLPTDFTKLDTFDIMQRARYHMEHGNLPNALRYVNLLQGAPRAAARSWADAARRHLEIRQAAETVMAHASVSGLLYQ